MTTIIMKGHIVAEGHLTVSRPNTAKGRMPRLPNGSTYFPSSSLNGLWRHAAHEAVAMHREKRHKPKLSLDAHYMLASGVDTARVLENLDMGGSPGAELPVRAKNPLISLFGRWKLAGNLCMGDAFASSQDVIVQQGDGSRSHPFRRRPELTHFVSDEEMDRLESILNADSESSELVKPLEGRVKELKAAMRGATAEIKAGFQAEIAELDAKIKEIKTGREGAKESVQRPLDTYEAIAAGSVLEHEMRIQGGAELEIGAFLWTTRHVASKPYVGGHKRSGLGRISASWDVRQYAPGANGPEVIGKVSFDDLGFHVEGEKLLAALAAFEEAMESEKVALDQFV